MHHGVVPGQDFVEQCRIAYITLDERESRMADREIVRAPGVGQLVQYGYLGVFAALIPAVQDAGHIPGSDEPGPAGYQQPHLRSPARYWRGRPRSAGSAPVGSGPGWWPSGQ